MQQDDVFNSIRSLGVNVPYDCTEKELFDALPRIVNTASITAVINTQRVLCEWLLSDAAQTRFGFTACVDLLMAVVRTAPIQIAHVQATKSPTKVKLILVGTLCAT